MATITHHKVSVVADGADTTLVRPSDWNQTHDFNLAASDVGAEPSGAVATHAGLSDPHTGYQKESEKGANSGYAPLDSGGLVPVANLPSLFIDKDFSHQGACIVETGVFKWYNDTGRTLTFSSIRITLGTVNTGATFIVDVLVDGSTIYTTGPGTNRPAIAASASPPTTKNTGYDVTTIADGHYLSVDIKQIGSTVAGSDLLVQVTMKG